MKKIVFVLLSVVMLLPVFTLAGIYAEDRTDEFLECISEMSKVWARFEGKQSWDEVYKMDEQYNGADKYPVDSGLILDTEKPGRNDLGVVHDHDVVRAEVINDIVELPVLYRAFLSVEDHEPAFVTLAHRFLGDELLRKIVIKIVYVHIVSLYIYTFRNFI